MNKKNTGIIVVIITILVGAIGAGIFLPRVFYTDLESIESSENKTVSETENSKAVSESASASNQAESTPEPTPEPVIPSTPFEDEEVYYVMITQSNGSHDASDKNRLYGVGNKSYQMYEYTTEARYISSYAGTRDGRYLFYEDTAEGEEGGIIVKSYDGLINKKIMDRAGYDTVLYVFQNRYLIAYGSGNEGTGWYLYDVLQPDTVTWIGDGPSYDSIAASEGNGFTFLQEDGLYYFETGVDEKPRKLADGNCSYSYVKEDDLSVITFIQDGNAYCIFNQQMPIYYGSADKVIYADENQLICNKGIYRNGMYYTYENTYQYIDSDGRFSAEFVAYDKMKDLAYLKVVGRNDYLEWTEIIGCYFDERGTAIMQSLNGYPGFLNDSGQVLMADNGWLYTVGISDTMVLHPGDDEPIDVQGQAIDLNYFDKNTEFWKFAGSWSGGEISFFSNDKGYWISEKGFIREVRPLSEGNMIFTCFVITDEQTQAGSYVYKIVYVDEDKITFAETPIESDFINLTGSINAHKKINKNIFLVSGANTLEVIDNKGEILKLLYENENEWWAEVENSEPSTWIMIQ